MKDRKHPFNHSIMHRSMKLKFYQLVNRAFHRGKTSIDILFIEKFKRPADDEDIYEPNRAKKSSKFKVEIPSIQFPKSRLFSRLQSDRVLNKQANPCPTHSPKRPKTIRFPFSCLLLFIERWIKFEGQEKSP